MSFPTVSTADTLQDPAQPPKSLSHQRKLVGFRWAHFGCQKAELPSLVPPAAASGVGCAGCRLLSMRPPQHPGSSHRAPLCCPATQELTSPQNTKHAFFLESPAFQQKYFCALSHRTESFTLMIK